MQKSSYTPRTWRTHPLHLCPPEPYEPNDDTRQVIDYIFLISSLNFSFWTDKAEEHRYAVEWWNSWSCRTYKLQAPVCVWGLYGEAAQIWDAASCFGNSGEEVIRQGTHHPGGREGGAWSGPASGVLGCSAMLSSAHSCRKG